MEDKIFDVSTKKESLTNEVQTQNSLDVPTKRNKVWRSTRKNWSFAWVGSDCTDSPDHELREVIECKFYVSEPTRKFSHAPQNTSSYSLKYNFLHVISAELLLKLAETTEKHEKSSPHVCDN